MKRRRPGPRPLELAPSSGAAAPAAPPAPAAGACRAGGRGRDGDGARREDGARAGPPDGPGAAELRRLADEARALQDKVAALEEDNFALRSELWCKTTEEKHGNAQVVSNLRAQLNFKEKELKESDAALRKERAQRKRAQDQVQALQQQLERAKRQLAAENVHKVRAGGLGEPRPLQMQARHASTTSAASGGSARTPLQKLPSNASTLSSSSSLSLVSAATPSAPSLSTRPPKLPNYFTPEDHVVILTHLERSNAVALSEGQVERVLVDEVAVRLESGRTDALEAVLRVLGKCIRKRRPTLTCGIASELLVPAFVKIFDRSREKTLTEAEMCACATISNFLTPLARRTRKPSAESASLAEAFSGLVNAQKDALQAWLGAPDAWAQVLELLAAATAVQASALEAAALPNMYKLLHAHYEQAPASSTLTSVLEFCATLLLAKPSYFSELERDGEAGVRGPLVQLLRTLADDGVESAAWLRSSIAKAAAPAPKQKPLRCRRDREPSGS